jgi:hypothetical protein
MSCRVPTLGVLLVQIMTNAAPALCGEPIDGTRVAAGISADRLLSSVRTLSGFDGRQSGTAGGEAAAAYIAQRLPAARLQSFSLTTVKIPSPVQAGISAVGDLKSLRSGVDFLPILSGVSASWASAPVVFVGYGIADSARGLDEYQNVAVTGKVVLFLRGQPQGYEGRISHADKEKAARAKGAIGYLTVTGPILSAYEQRRGMNPQPMAFFDSETQMPLPGLWITPAVADVVLEPLSLTLESFQREMAGSLRNRSTETGTRINLAMEQHHLIATAANVSGFWAGSDPELHSETIVVGAHYDHFGIQEGMVFSGADDNASGTAIILELARLLTAVGTRTKRSILFIAFAGEEQGLLGSKHYVANPQRPLGSTKSMINVDHAGVGNGKITIGLSRIDRAQAQAAAELAGLRDQIELFGFFPGGDHVPFNEAGVPTAVVVSSGAHSDFHRPSDTPDRVNPEILVSAARYTLSLLLTLANAEP